MSPSGALGALLAIRPTEGLLRDAKAVQRFHRPSRTNSAAGVMVDVAVSRSAKVTAATPSAEMQTAPKRGKVNLSTPSTAPRARVKKPLAEPIVVPLATDVNPRPALMAQLAPNQTSVNCDARTAVSLSVNGGSGKGMIGAE